MRADTREAGGTGNRGALLLLAAVNFLVLLDVTIINVALPSIGREFGAGGAALQWLVSGYTLTYALGLLPAGRLGDRVGPRGILMAGLGLFLLSSLLCGLAPSILWLQAGRVLQGAGAAMMSPQAMAVAHRMFQGQARAGAFAVFGLVAGLASVMGPLVGGWLVSGDFFGLGWRPIFLINPPLALLLGLVLRRWIPAMAGNPGVRFDPVAVVLSGLGLLMILIPLIEGRAQGWPLWSLAMAGTAVPVFAGLYLWERARARAGRAQLLPLALLRAGDYAWFGVAIGLFFAGLPGFFMILAVFLQDGFGFSPMQSGLTAFPLSLGIMVASMLTPALRAVPDRLRVAVGAVLVLCGLGLLRWQLAGFTGIEGQARAMGCLGLAGVGFGLVVGPLFHLALEPVPEREAGIASALLQMFQQLGGAFGIGLTGAVFFAGLEAGDGWTAAFGAGMAVTMFCFLGFLLVFAGRWAFGRAAPAAGGAL